MYQPGLLIGGKIEHECNTQRSIGYYLEGLTCLAPFTKKPIHAVLQGVTNDQIDPSVRYFPALLYIWTTFWKKWLYVKVYIFVELNKPHILPNHLINNL